eukprot:13845815-Alexandrium_andersonii.AAC.1
MCGLDPATLARLVFLGPPPVLFQILRVLRKHGGAAVKCLDFREFFVGEARLSKGLREKGLE